MTEASPIPQETRARLERFTRLLGKWNNKLNLLAARDMPVVWERHVVDSLQLAPLIPPDIDRAIDLGSGGGFPGLVLAIATGTPFHLIEADRRKAAFLRSAVLETDAPATVHACRIEDAGVPPAPLVTARALAPLPRLLALAAPLLAANGVCLLPKGAKAAAEVEAARRDWTMTIDPLPSRTGGGAILRVTGLRRRRPC